MKRNFRDTFFLLFSFIFLSNGIFAQVDTVRFNKYYFKKYWTDTKVIVTSPAKWDEKDWSKLGAFVAAEGCFLFVDKPVNDFFHSNRNSNLDYVSKKFLEPFGANYSLLLMSGFLAHGLLARNERSVSTALLSLESFALSSLFTRIPKIIAGRERPDNLQGEGPFAIKGPFYGSSFPSGHTTAAFSVASVIATQYRETKWVPVAAYSVASLVGLSRIYDNKHWLTDVIGGAAIGTLVGNLVSHRTSNSKLTIVPFGNSTYQGINLTYTW